MKKSLVTSIFIVFLAFSVSAQDFGFGPKLGVSSSWVNTRESISVAGSSINFDTGDPKLGFHAGVFGRIGIMGFFAQPEILFSSTGGTVNVSDGSGVIQDVISYDFNKVDVPIMFGYRFAGIFRVQAGPIFSTLLSANASSDLLGGSVDVKDEYRNSTVGYQAGVGLDVGPIIVDLKFEGNLSAFGDEIQGQQTDQRNQQVILSAGYRF